MRDLRFREQFALLPHRCCYGDEIIWLTLAYHDASHGWYCLNRGQEKINMEDAYVWDRQQRKWIIGEEARRPYRISLRRRCWTRRYY